MFSKTGPGHNKRKIIRLVVKDEQALYTALSPDDEFEDAVKNYIRSKITVGNYSRSTGLTVICRNTINEGRFRSAVINWARDEKKVFQKDRRENVRLMIGLLLFGSVSVVLSIKLQEQFEVVKYSLIPIMSSLSLSRAVGLLIIDIPIISSKIAVLKEMEKDSVVTFEYQPDAKEADAAYASSLVDGQI